MNEQLKIIISAEIDKLKKGIQDAKSEIDGLDDKTGTSSTSIKDKFSKIGAGAKTAMGVVSKAIAGGVTAMVGLVAATEQYSINQAKLTSAFTTAGASAETATATYNGLYRVLGDGDVATEAANHLAKLTTNQKELEQWTTICQGVYATFGDSLPIEGLTEAANETAKTGVVTGQLADALNWAGISEDEFNAKLAACNSEAEREKLIRTTLNGVYDEAAARYEKNAADIIAQNEAQAKLQASLALVGEALRPVVTAFTNFGADALAVVAPLLQNLADVILPVMQAALATVKEKIDEVKAGFEAATEWVNNHQGAVTAVAIAVGILNYCEGQ